MMTSSSSSTKTMTTQCIFFNVLRACCAFAVAYNVKGNADTLRFIFFPSLSFALFVSFSVLKWFEEDLIPRIQYLYEHLCASYSCVAQNSFVGRHHTHDTQPNRMMKRVNEDNCNWEMKSDEFNSLFIQLWANEYAIRTKSVYVKINEPRQSNAYNSVQSTLKERDDHMSTDSVRRREIRTAQNTRIRTHQTNERKKYSKLITVWVSFANEQQHEQFHFGPFYFSQRKRLCFRTSKSKLISWKPSTAGCENYHTIFSINIENERRKKEKNRCSSIHFNEWSNVSNEIHTNTRLASAAALYGTILTKSFFLFHFLFLNARATYLD